MLCDFSEREKLFSFSDKISSISVFYEKAKKIIENEFSHEIRLNKLNSVSIEKNMVNIAVVGDKMKDHQGISGKSVSCATSICISSERI